MHKGAIVEELDAFHLADAKHPYTKVLLSSIFEIGQDHKPLTLEEAAVEAQDFGTTYPTSHCSDRLVYSTRGFAY